MKVKRIGVDCAQWISDGAGMSTPETSKGVERMFPFVLRARILIIGREALHHSKSKLHFVLLTHDVSPASKDKILKDYAYYPVVQHYTSEDLEKHFGVKGAKVLGFSKSTLAQSIYAELKPYRVNRPATPVKPRATVKESMAEAAGKPKREKVRRRTATRPRR
jgi:hypothetical protein